MPKKLAANVYVDGVLYEAGSAPAKDIADQITNPKAWGEDEPDGKPAARKPASKD